MLDSHRISSFCEQDKPSESKAAIAWLATLIHAPTFNASDPATDNIFFLFYHEIKEASANGGCGGNEKVIRTIQYGTVHAESIKDKSCTEGFVGEMIEGDGSFAGRG